MNLLNYKNKSDWCLVLKTRPRILIFTVLAPWPIQSISPNICVCVVCLSPSCKLLLEGGMKRFLHYFLFKFVTPPNLMQPHEQTRHGQGSETDPRIGQLYAWVQTLDRPSPSEFRLGFRLDSKPGSTKPHHAIIEKIIDLTIDFQQYLSK